MKPPRIASLPMYDFPEIRPALDRFWDGLVKHMADQGIGDVPGQLTHGRPVNELWDNPDLLLTQCCGYDVVNRYRDSLMPVALPHYSASGCCGPEYSSLIVVRDDNPARDVLEMAGSIAVINGLESHSGMSALRHLVATQNQDGKFFAEVRISGAHVESLDYIKSGRADVAPIDCVTYALLERFRPQSVWGLRVLGRTFSAPAPPFVIRRDDDGEQRERMWNALREAFEDSTLRHARQQLLLADIEPATDLVYQKMVAFNRFAESHGYPDLA